MGHVQRGRRHFASMFARKNRCQKFRQGTRFFECLESRLLLDGALAPITGLPVLHLTTISNLNPANITFNPSPVALTGASPLQLAGTVGANATDVALNLSATASTFGQPVTLSATVNDSNVADPAATGNVWFTDTTNNISYGPAPLNNGSAALTLSTLAVGTDAITAEYLGDGAHATSTTPSQSVTVSPLATAVDLVSSGTGTAVSGPTLSVVVKSVGGALFGGETAPCAPAGPTAPVQVGGTLNVAPPVSASTNNIAMGTLTLSGNSWNPGSIIVATGTGVLTVSGPTVSTGGTLLNVSGFTVTGTVIGPTTAVTLRGVTPAPSIPTGTVTFMDGTLVLGTATLNNGAATFTPQHLAAGAHTITAIYNGDTNFTGSTSANMAANIQADTTTTTLTSTANPAAVGAAFSLGFTVSTALPETVAPTGTVALMDGPTTLASVNLNGTATLAQLSTGTHALTAVYSGDNNYPGSTSPVLLETVTGKPTAIQTKNSGAGTPTLAPTLSVMITDPAGQSYGNESWPSVQAGATTSANGTLIATLPAADYPNFTPYSGALTAIFVPDSSGGIWKGGTGASGSISFTGNTGGVLTLGGSSNYVPPPTGTVTFLEGATVLGTAALSGGAAAFSPQGLAVGDHTITVQYSGDANYAACTSGTTAVSIQNNHTTTALSSNIGPVLPGGTVSWNFTVTSTLPDSVTPTGTVTINDGATPLATVNLGATPSLPFDLVLGAHNLTATYSGDADFTASTSPVYIQDVGYSVTTTTVLPPAFAPCNPDPGYVVGDAVTLVATITTPAAQANTPTGSVTFADGGTILGTAAIDGSGTARFAAGQLGVGAHQITAIYGGAPYVGGSISAPTTIAVREQHAPANLAYLTGLYRDLLHRPIDPVGQAGWGQALDAGATFDAVAQDIVGSREYQGNLIDAYYVQYLDRHAETTGLNAWVDLMQNGANAAQIRAGILGSAEYFARTGGSAAPYVTALYQDLLGRTPDAGGFADWTGLLVRGTPAQISLGISNSAECRAVTISGLYQDFLDRAPDPVGLSNWDQLLANGVSQPQIVTAFVTAPEYLQRIGIA